MPEPQNNALVAMRGAMPKPPKKGEVNA